MRLLVLFALWAPDAGANTQAWLRWYQDILGTRFAGDDIFIAVNHGTPEGSERPFADLAAVIGSERVPREMHVDSDAAGFQLALARCRDRLDAYDYTLFLHTKGISHPFAEYAQWRGELESTLFAGTEVATLMQDRPMLICHRGHMTQAASSINECRMVANALGNDAAVFNFAATKTIFYAPAATLRDFASRLPPEYFTENLLSLGHNRFFFEGVVPSQLVMLGAEPVFMGGASLDARLNGDVSFAHAARHNSGLVAREFGRWSEQGRAYRQAPIPYVFCRPDDLYEIEVAFSI